MAIITVDYRSLGISEAEVDALPRGLVRVDSAGKVLYYDEATRGLVATGINFFAAAPLEAVRALKAPFDRIAAAPGARIEPFSFLFRFAWGDREATFTMVRRSEDRLYIFITDKRVATLAA